MMFPPSPLMEMFTGRRPVQVPAIKSGVRWAVASASPAAMAPLPIAEVNAARKTSSRARRMLEFYSIALARVNFVSTSTAGRLRVFTTRPADGMGSGRSC